MGTTYFFGVLDGFDTHFQFFLVFCNFSSWNFGIREEEFVFVGEKLEGSGSNLPGLLAQRSAGVLNQPLASLREDGIQFKPRGIVVVQW